MKDERRVVWEGLLPNSGGVAWRVVVALEAVHRIGVIVEREGYDALDVTRWEDVPNTLDQYGQAVAAAVRHLLEIIDNAYEEANEDSVARGSAAADGSGSD